MVKQGDTLYSIALEHGADYREVAHWNTLDDPTKLRVGQVLRVSPQLARRGTAAGRPVDRRAAPGAVEAAPDEDAPGAAHRQTSGRPRGAPPAKPPRRRRRRAKPSREPASATPSVDFIWPAKGKVLAGFAEPRSKGIDIDGKPGDPVVAAAAGRVTYIGTGIPRLGKLVVIKHDNGFITVYAHNREILVKEEQAVTRGAEDRRARRHRRRPRPSCTSRSARPASRSTRCATCRAARRFASAAPAARSATADA